jgi:hypothetical protein
MKELTTSLHSSSYLCLNSFHISTTFVQKAEKQTPAVLLTRHLSKLSMPIVACRSCLNWNKCQTIHGQFCTNQYNLTWKLIDIALRLTN